MYRIIESILSPPAAETIFLDAADVTEQLNHVEMVDGGEYVVIGVEPTCVVGDAGEVAHDHDYCVKDEVRY